MFSRLSVLNQCLRKQKNSPCVDDYIQNIDDIKEYLSRNEELLVTDNQLTFGYQKDWARYVNSAKRQETQ